MITIILVRHGERQHKQEDADDPLTQSAWNKAVNLGARLRSLIPGPDVVVLTSAHEHSRQTARALVQGAQWGNIAMHDAFFLTPGGHWDDDIYEELGRRTGQGDVVVVAVGHETRLSQLVLRFTGTRQRTLGALEAIAISAGTLERLRFGKGEEEWRYPVRNWLEKEIAEKLTSKMTVATFLASANFVALMEIIIGQRDILLGPGKLVPKDCEACNWLLPFEPSWLLIWLALLSHLTAAGLFIATVYLYDRLSMPVGFWTLKPPDWIKAGDKRGKDRLLLDGYPQAHMIRIWQRVFTPAVAFSTIGVFLLIATSGVGLALVAAGIVATIIMIMFRDHLPTASID